MSAPLQPWRSAAAVVLLAAALTAAAVTVIRYVRPPAPSGSATAAGLPIADLERPDLLIRTRALSGLPADLVRAPLLRDILTEDLVGYYADHPGRLGLEGSLRRLAFDHQLSFAERLIAQALDAPAELALWRNGRGQPDHFVIVLEHTLTSRAIYELARVALPDRQLSRADELTGGIPLYALRLDARTTWLLASRGDRAVLLSDPGLVLRAEGRLSPATRLQLESLLEPGQASSRLARSFELRPLDPGARHDLSARIGMLTWGYEHFLPGLEALRLRAGQDGHWTAAARVSDAARERWQAGARALWPTLPHDSAVCATLPLQPTAAAPIARAALTQIGSAWLDSFEPGAAVCWNTAGGLFAPVFAGHLRAARPAELDRQLGAVFDQILRRSGGDDAEDGGKDGGGNEDQDEGQSSAKNDDEGADVGAAQAGSRRLVTAGTASPPSRFVERAFEGLPGRVESAIEGLDDSRIWLRAVPHALGSNRHQGVRGHAVALARVNHRLWATIDAQALRPSLAVAARTWPALADAEGRVTAAPASMTATAGATTGPTTTDPTALAADAIPVLAIDGGQLARLLDSATWASLSPRRTPTFHRVARALLPERLQAVTALGRIRVELRDPRVQAADEAAGPGWQALTVVQNSTATAAGGRP